MPDIFEKVSEMEAERFWVSEERAIAVITALKRGKNPGRMRSNKIEMFEEILKRVNKLLIKNPALSLKEAICQTIIHRAPKFYLTPRTIGEIVYRIKRSKRKLQYTSSEGCL